MIIDLSMRGPRLVRHAARSAAPEARALLEVTGLAYRPISYRLSGLQRLIDGCLPGDRTRDALAHYRAKRLELRNPNELHAGIWHRLRGRMIWIRRLDRVSYEL